MDAAQGGGAGIYPIYLEPDGDIEDAVGQLVAFGDGLVLADEEYEVAALWVFQVVEAALGELGFLYYIVPGDNADSVEEVGWFDFPQVFEVELFEQVAGDYYRYVADAGPGGEHDRIFELGAGV
jgi:hypothetical protein